MINGYVYLSDAPESRFVACPRRIVAYFFVRCFFGTLAARRHILTKIGFYFVDMKPNRILFFLHRQGDSPRSSGRGMSRWYRNSAGTGPGRCNVPVSGGEGEWKWDAGEHVRMPERGQGVSGLLSASVARGLRPPKTGCVVGGFLPERFRAGSACGSVGVVSLFPCFGEQGAGSREQGAGSREQGAGSRFPGTMPQKKAFPVKETLS